VYLALPAVLMLGMRWAVLRHEPAMDLPFLDNPLTGTDFATARVTAIRVIGKYLWLLVWPRTLSADYSYNQIPLLHWHSANWQDWTAVAAVLGLLMLAVACYRRSRTAFFLLGFSALTLLPAANLVVMSGTIMAERLLYLPSVGFAAAVAIGIHGLARRLGLRPWVAAVALGTICVAYGARTYQRNPDWQDDETLFGSAVEAAPHSFRTHLSLSSALYRKDPDFFNGERAVEEAERGAAIANSLPDNKNSPYVAVILGGIYFARGDSLAPKDADGTRRPGAASVSWYMKALEADLDGVAVDRISEENHRRAELARGTPPGRIGLQGPADLYGNLGLVYVRLGDPQQALQAFLQERRRVPHNLQAYSNVAAAYLALNKTEEAVTVLLESLALEDSPLTRSRISELYGKLDGGGCAMAGHSLNRDCPIVRRDLCNSYRDVEETFHGADLSEVADRAREAGRREGCQ
jgi:tetratricopeptide (TPR) repeat protein